MVNKIETPRRSVVLLTQQPSSTTAEEIEDAVVPVDSSQLKHLCDQQASESENSLPPEHRHSVEKDPACPSLPPSPSPSLFDPTTYPPTEMTDPTVISVLIETSKIKQLNGPDDWVEWNRSLKGHLGIVDLWTTLTGDVPAPVPGTPQHTVWQSDQRKLASLLLLVTGPSTIRVDVDKTATEQFKVLKNTYSKTTIYAYSTLYRRINSCSLSSHQSLKEYGEEVIEARNKLRELKRPVDELHVACAFLDGLDTSYQDWKSMFLGIYAMNPTKIENGVEIMNVPTIEEILQLLIYRESSTPSSPMDSATRAFGAQGRENNNKKDRNNKMSSNEDSSNSRPPARSGNSSVSLHTQRYCDTCYSTRHTAAQCWLTHSEKQSAKFKTKYPNADAIKLALEEAQDANREW